MAPRRVRQSAPKAPESTSTLKWVFTDLWRSKLTLPGEWKIASKTIAGKDGPKEVFNLCWVTPKDSRVQPGPMWGGEKATIFKPLEIPVNVLKDGSDTSLAFRKVRRPDGKEEGTSLVYAGGDFLRLVLAMIGGACPSAGGNLRLVFTRREHGEGEKRVVREGWALHYEPEIDLLVAKAGPKPILGKGVHISIPFSDNSRKGGRGLGHLAPAYVVGKNGAQWGSGIFHSGSMIAWCLSSVYPAQIEPAPKG